MPFFRRGSHRRIATIILLPLALAGCFRSETPLIASENTIFPALEISVAVEADAVSTFVRADDRYVLITDDPAGMAARLQDLGDGLYLVEIASDYGGIAGFAHVVVRYLPESAVAEVVRAVAAVEDGIAFCAEATVCLETTEPLIALARAAIAAGAEPEGTYPVTLRE